MGSRRPEAFKLCGNGIKSTLAEAPCTASLRPEQLWLVSLDALFSPHLHFKTTKKKEVK